MLTRFRPWPSHEQWLRERGRPDLAEEWRHRERAGAFIEGAKEVSPHPGDIGDFHGTALGWQVLYQRAGRRSRSPSFADQGRKIAIHDLSRDSVRAALQLASEKWGTFKITGPRKFRKLCAELAAQHGFRITNPELQKLISAQRQGLNSPNPKEPEHPAQGPHPARARGLVRDVHDAYQKHFEQIRRDGDRNRSDISRVDSRIAVLLRATGYPRNEIESGISKGAKRMRPSEQLNWKEYSRRATDVAFGPIGEQLLGSLQKRPERILERDVSARPEPSRSLPPPRPIRTRDDDFDFGR